MTEVEQQVVIIAEKILHFSLKTHNTTDSINLINTDSIEHVEFIMELEKIFDLDIPDKDAEILMKGSIDGVVKYIQKKGGRVKTQYAASYTAMTKAVNDVPSASRAPIRMVVNSDNIQFFHGQSALPTSDKSVQSLIEILANALRQQQRG